MAKKSLIAKSGKEVLGRFDLDQVAPCALVVATFGNEQGQVLFDGLIVWNNQVDGDASESYDTFASVVIERIKASL